MQLARVVELVGRLRATAKKTEKVGLLAEFLRQTQGKETELAAWYLTGTLSQGKIGVGWRMVQDAMGETGPSESALTLLELDGMQSARLPPIRDPDRPGEKSARCADSLNGPRLRSDDFSRNC